MEPRSTAVLRPGGSYLHVFEPGLQLPDAHWVLDVHGTSRPRRHTGLAGAAGALQAQLSGVVPEGMPHSAPLRQRLGSAESTC